MPCAASPPMIFCQLKVVTSSLSKGTLGGPGGGVCLGVFTSVAGVLATFGETAPLGGLGGGGGGLRLVASGGLFREDNRLLVRNLVPTTLVAIVIPSNAKCSINNLSRN